MKKRTNKIITKKIIAFIIKLFTVLAGFLIIGLSETIIEMIVGEQTASVLTVIIFIISTIWISGFIWICNKIDD